MDIEKVREFQRLFDLKTELKLAISTWKECEKIEAEKKKSSGFSNWINKIGFHPKDKKIKIAKTNFYYNKNSVVEIPDELSSEVIKIIEDYIEKLEKQTDEM